MAGHRTKHGRKRKYRANAGVLLIAAVVLIFAVVMNVHMRGLAETDRTYQAKEEALTSELAEEQERTEELEETKEYVQTDDYIEKTAREKLGLVMPDETVVKPSE